MPECVVFDSGYSRLENLKRVRDFGWVWLTRQKANRVVNPDRHGLCPVTRVETDAHGPVVHLRSCLQSHEDRRLCPSGGQSDGVSQ